MKPVPARSVRNEALQRLKQSGVWSPVLDARLEWSEAEGRSRYAQMIAGEERVYPSMLMTAQASGRFSTTDPPLINFPARDNRGVAWGMILPDPGTFWVHFDLDALHARIAACYTKDPVDLAAFQQGHDIHTVTTCHMFRHPLPVSRTKSCHTHPDDTEWRASWSPPWEGEQDRRRRLAKVFRYALLLGLNERSALESPEVAKLGLSRAEVLRFGRLYLNSKPEMVQAKQQIWAQVAQESKAYSFGGRLRRLYGEATQRAKDGWSHILQGGEQDMMDDILSQVFEKFPDAWLVLHGHDGATLGFLEKHNVPEDVEEVRRIVEREWQINGTSMPVPASWERVCPDGTRQGGLGQ